MKTMNKRDRYDSGQCRVVWLTKDGVEHQAMMDCEKAFKVHIYLGKDKDVASVSTRRI